MNSKFLKGTAAVLVAVLFLVIIMLAIAKWEKSLEVLPSAEEPSEQSDFSESEEEIRENLIYYDNAWYAYRDELTTVLFMGLDKFEEDQTLNRYSNSQQSDFLLLLVFDSEQNTCIPIQINRDTIVEFPVLDIEGNNIGSTTEQLALSHTYGSGKDDSCRNTAEAVSNLLYGVDIDHYVSVTMDAVQTLNDLIGGVTVTVLDDFSGIDPALEKGKEITLHGAQALTYVRTRMGLDDSTNLHRMERQRQYMTAFHEQFEKSITDSQELLPLALMEISSYMVSDCTADQLLELYDRLNLCDTADILTLEGEAVKEEKYMAFYPDEELLRATVIDIFYERKEAQ